MAAIISFEPWWITLNRAHILLLQRLLFFIRPSDAMNNLEPYEPDCAFTDIVANAKYPSVITGIMVKGGENLYGYWWPCTFSRKIKDFSFSMTDYFQTDDLFFLPQGNRRKNIEKERNLILDPEKRQRCSVWILQLFWLRGFFWVLICHWCLN